MRPKLRQFAVRAAFVFALAAGLSLPAAAAGRMIVHVRPAFGYMYGPGWGPWGPIYNPWFYEPFPVVTHPNSGQVKFDTSRKTAEVFIDGAYAGQVHDLKSVWLRSGTHTIELRAAGFAPFTEKIYVLPGKTFHIRPEFVES